MNNRPTYNELVRKIETLKNEALEYIQNEKNLNDQRKTSEYSHLKRSLSLMKINMELVREIQILKSSNQSNLELFSDRLKEKIQELNCLYGISKLRATPNFSLDEILQDVVDLIPQSTLHPEHVSARITLNSFYEIKTNNFELSQWLFSHEIRVYNERVGILEVCSSQPMDNSNMAFFPQESANIFIAIAENIAQIVEREWAEEEIRKKERTIIELVKRDH